MLISELVIIQWIRESRAMIGIAHGLIGFLIALRLATWDKSENTNRSKYLILLLVGIGLSGVIEGISLIIGQSLDRQTLGVIPQVFLLVSGLFDLIPTMIYTLYIFGIVNGVAPYSNKIMEERIYEFLHKEIEKVVDQRIEERTAKQDETRSV